MVISEMPRKAKSAMRVTFGPYQSIVAFEGCDDLLAGFQSILKGWTIKTHEAASGVAPIMRFSKQNGRFIWRSKQLPPPKDWTPKGPESVLDAVADFHYRFLDWHSLEFHDHYCLHCAAVEMAGGLVIFPSIQKAGKSTLVVELAMLGFEVFCDDVLPIVQKDGTGFAMGIAPRLRLPMPDAVSARHRAFVQSRLGLSDTSAGYLNLKDDEIAPFGKTAPIRAIVLLDRKLGQVNTLLSEASKAETLACLIDQNYAEHLSATAIFDDLLRLAEGADRKVLTFSDVGDAARQLATRYG